MLGFVVASPIEPTPQLTGPDAERLVEELGRGCSPAEHARRVADAREHLAATFHPNADALYHDPRDPEGMLRVVRTGEIAAPSVAKG